MMRRKQGPVFQGLASPSLKKMRRMSPEQLEIHVRTLNEHAEIIRAKLERQQNHPQPPGPRKVQAAQRQLSRLEALADYGEQLAREQSSAGYQGGDR